MAELARAFQLRAPELDAELVSQHGHLVLSWGAEQSVHWTATVHREAPSRYELLVFENPFWRPLALRSNLTVDAAVDFALAATKAGGPAGVAR